MKLSGFFSLLVLGAGLAVPASVFGQAQPDLKGTVAGADGKPLKDATAYIYTAAVRRGTSPY